MTMTPSKRQAHPDAGSRSDRRGGRASNQDRGHPRRATGAGQSSAPSTVAPRKGWRWWGIAVAATLVVAAAVAGLAVVWSDDEVAARTAELQAVEEQRLQAQTQEVTDLAGQVAAGLGPLVRTYAPADDGALAAPSSEELRTITAVLGDLSSELAKEPSAGTEVNVARSGLRTTVDLFTAAVTAHELAAAVDGGGDARLESHATDLGRQGLRALDRGRHPGRRRQRRGGQRSRPRPAAIGGARDRPLSSSPWLGPRRQGPRQPVLRGHRYRAREGPAAWIFWAPGTCHTPPPTTRHGQGPGHAGQ